MYFVVSNADRMILKTCVLADRRHSNVLAALDKMSQKRNFGKREERAIYAEVCHVFMR
jgi:hypothetical protein